MTSPRLQILERKMARHSQPEKVPAPAADDLTAAIQQLIDQRVSEALERQPVKQPAHIQRLLDQQFKPPMPTDYRQLPPTPKAPKPPFNMIIHRDAAGLITWTEMTNGLVTIRTQAIRDGAGKMIGMREIEESPVLPAPAIPFKAEAREYDPGTER